MVSTCAGDADSGCAMRLGKRASEFRWLGVEELNQRQSGERLGADGQTHWP